MGNIKNFNFNKLDIRLSNSEFWDFFLATDEFIPSQRDCLISYFDFNNLSIYVDECIFSNTISSLTSWTGATNTGYTFPTIGLTGIDNGLVTFEKQSGDTTNQRLLNALTGTTLIIPSGDTRLHLNKVTGTTGQFIYPIVPLIDNSGIYAQFNGGFYQGYYKIDGSSYQVWPERFNNGWVAQFWLKRDSSYITGNTGTTLNDVYPDNNGFFFYWGTRAENKFWNRFEGNNTGCTSACTADTGCTETVSEWCTIPKETDITISGSNGELITLYPNQTVTTEVTNPFLRYGRGTGENLRCSACGNPIRYRQLTVCTDTGQTITITKPKTVVVNTTNPFLFYGRASANDNRCRSCGGDPSGYGNQTVCTSTGFTKSIQFDNLDPKIDIIDNAIGFRIKDDGSIGYRLLTVTGSCSGDTYVSGVTIEEKYSVSGMVTPNKWTSVIVRYSTNYLDDCDLKIKPKRKGRLMFYIDGKLKFTVKNFNEFIGRRLEEHMEKQVGVPFNISIGGGSQGLIETQTFDGIDTADLGLYIERNFGGSFYGGISTFKFNACDLYFTDIQNIYNQEVDRYFAQPDSLAQENGFLILQEDGSRIVFTDIQNIYKEALEKCVDVLLQEDGSYMLQENNFKIIL